MVNYKWKLKDINKVDKNGYKVFSCFACGGGSCMGYKLAGYEVIGINEIDKAINKMYLKNFSPKYNYNMPIQKLVKMKDFPTDLYDIDILNGSPPCSTFSMAGKREEKWGVKSYFREGQEEQVLDDLFFYFIKLAEILKPKIVVAENVKGIISGNAKGYVNKIIKEYDRIGYDVQLFCLNAAEMGVPQRRERVFFVCRRKDLNLPKIKLEFHEKPIFYREFAEPKSKPLNKETQYYKLWLKRKPGDKDLGDIRKRIENKQSNFSTKLIYLNDIPNTLVSGSDYIRFDRPEKLSDMEFIHIQSFPEDYNFNGMDVKYVTGMSVPPLMMYRISKEIQTQLLDKIKG